MEKLTQRQEQVLDYIAACQEQQGLVPTLREIASHFQFRSMTAAADHVRALRRKGQLTHQPRTARAYRLLSAALASRRRLMRIPLAGSIPAGYAQTCEEASDETIGVDPDTFGLRGSQECFALRVRGDSMQGRHILDGDVAIIDRRRPPRHGDVVAALIDGESRLKTLVSEKQRTCLRAENLRYPELIPASELLIQGVLVGLIRPRP